MNKKKNKQLATFLCIYRNQSTMQILLNVVIFFLILMFIYIYPMHYIQHSFLILSYLLQILFIYQTIA